MDRAKRIMSTLLLNNSDSIWDIDRGRLAEAIESWFYREKKRDDPVRYTTVEEQRNLRLQIIGELLGRDVSDPLTSFKEPSATQSGNMSLVEARALRTFIDRMSFDIHGEVKAEYQAQSKVMLDEKEREWKAAESERQRLSDIGQVDRFGDFQIYLPDLQPASASVA